MISYLSPFLSGVFLYVAMHCGCKKDECPLLELDVLLVGSDEVGSDEVGAIVDV